MVDVEKFLVSLRGHKDVDGRRTPVYLADDVNEEIKIINEAVQYSKQWVGLTDAEVSKIIGDEIGFNACWGPEEDFAKAIESKLKEKNT
tara:strand:+ start:666 stop:932 length:267 start_codon:yes stop_codon:yes gene_type:complete